MNVKTPRVISAVAAAVVGALALGGATGVWSVGDPANAGTGQAVATEAPELGSGDLLRAAPPVALPGVQASDPGERDTASQNSDGDDGNAGGNRGAGKSGGADRGDEGLPPRSGKGRRVVFDMGEQRVWLVNGDGMVQRTYLVSGSKHGNLDPGRYRVYSKSRTTVSYTLDETMRHMVRFAHGENAAIGFHDIPVSIEKDRKVQTVNELGERLSAGCVRQAPVDARAMWRFADIGTRVVVVR